MENEFSVNFSQDSDIDKFQTLVIRKFFEKTNMYFIFDHKKEFHLGGWQIIKSTNFIFGKAYSYWIDEISKMINDLGHEFFKSIPDWYKPNKDEYPTLKTRRIALEIAYDEYKPHMPPEIVESAKIKAFECLKSLKSRAEEIVNRENQNIELINHFFKN